MRKATLVCAAILFGLGIRGFAAGYTFVKLAEAGPGSPNALAIPSCISRNGVAGVGITRKDGGAGFYTTTDGNLTKVIDTSGEILIATADAMNPSGTLVLNATLDDLSTGIFTLSAGVLKPVLKTAGLLGSKADINDRGDVSFVVNSAAFGLAGGSKVILSSGGSPVTIADQTGQFSGLLLSGGAINNNGRVVFLATDFLGQKGGLYTGGDGPITNLVAASPTLSFAGTIFVSINDSGAIAFNSFDPTRLTVNINVWENGKLRKVAGSEILAADGPFQSVGWSNINNAGMVAFLGFGNTGYPHRGIYTGPDAAKDKVIAIGDSLFGSTVADVGTGGGLGGRYLDDQGRILFFYALLDGRNGAALATPGSASAGLPGISANGVVNGAGFQPGIVANSWATIFGANLASVTDDWSKHIVNGQFPTVLDGVSVTIGGKPAYIYYVTPGQLNVLVPDIGSGPAQVTVTNSSGTSTAFTVTSSLYGPAFFAWPNNQPVATRQDFSLAARNGTFAGAATVPAKPGDIVILWGTGFGPTVPAAPAGVAVPSDRTYSTATLPTVTINNVPATVFGAALAPGFAGLYQVAIQVPSSIADGDWPIQATIGGVPSPTGVLLSVRN